MKGHRPIHRTCPICSTSFIPKQINSTTCNLTCGKRAERLRAKGRAYEAGSKNILTDTLEVILRVREVDAEVGVIVAEQRLSSQMTDQDADDEESSEDHHLLAIAERADAQAMSDALRRKRAGGWVPLGSSPSPFKRKGRKLKLNGRCQQSYKPQVHIGKFQARKISSQK